MAPGADSFGAAIGTGLEHISNKLFDHREAEYVKANQIRVAHAKAELLGEANGYLRDPKTGAFVTKRGEAAMSLGKDFREHYEKTYARISGSLANDDQRLALELESLPIFQGFASDVDEHTRVEAANLDQANHQSILSIEASGAVEHASNPERVMEHVHAIEDELQSFASRNGLPKTWLADQNAKARSQVWTGVIDRLASVPETGALLARNQFLAVKDQIIGPERDRLETKLTAAVVQNKAAAAANQLWVKHEPPPSDSADLKSMLDGARDQYGESNPELFKAVSDLLKDRANVHDQAVAQRGYRSASKVWSAIADGIGVEDLVTMPEYQALSGKEQTDAREHALDRGFTLQQRGRGELTWLWQVEDHNWTQKQRAEAEKTKAGFATFLELSRPERLAQMNEDQILALRGKLGDDLTLQLFNHFRSLQVQGAADAKKVLQASVDDEQFNAIAFSAGLPAYKSSSQRTDIENARLGMLKSRVLMQISIDQDAKKRQLTDSEKVDVMKRLVDDKVKLMYKWSDQPTFPAGSILPSDSPYTTQPLILPRIPSENLVPAITYLRSISVVPAGMSDQQAARQFKDRLERAYSARQAGKFEEATRILRGETPTSRNLAREFADRVFASGR